MDIVERIYDLFQLSFQDCRQCTGTGTGMEVSTPAESGLSPIYKNLKDFPNLAFFREQTADDNKSCNVLLYARDNAPNVSHSEL
jgi:hypothetical protein